jgi:anti-sigma regulatory factor (Ser/Thr protein kinase)
LVRVACRDWGAGEVADDAVVVASELVGNAVEHAGTLCRLTLTLDRRELTVAVRDGRPGTIRRLRPVEPLARRGRGLLLTAGVSRRWGVTEHEQGKTVWAVLPVPLPPGPETG